MIASAAYVTDVLKRHGISPNKNLGQNFFINGDCLLRLISDVPLDGKNVLEIGPGLGALTELLLLRGARVTAVEKDPVLIPLLREALPSPLLTVIEGDCLRVCKDLVHYPFTAVGNLPYCITADIIEMLFKMHPEQMVFMLQKEAADRFFATPSQKNYVPLGAACSLYYTATRLGDISPDNYLPAPGVTSTLVHLKQRDDAPEYDPALLLSFFCECFRMRRKTLINNLSSYKQIRPVVAELGISASVRAEALSPEILLMLYQALKSN